MNVGSDTTVQETTVGTLSDLQEGESLTVIGTLDANGNITATSIIIQPQGQGTPPTPPGFTNKTAPTITSLSLPAGEVGALYSQTLGASGGTTPYTWSITGGSLPAGLSLNTSGVITGTPTAAGTSSFTAQVTDSVGAMVTQPLSITVNTALTVTNLSLPAGEVGVLYSQTLSASGGTTPYTWSNTGGSHYYSVLLEGNKISTVPYTWSSIGGSLRVVPPMDTSGVITGMPTVVGISSFTAQVTDNVGATATKLLSITVNPRLTITTPSLPAGKLGVLYSQILGASGGTTPYTWLITGGSLPAGLLLDTSGVITGTPTSAGISSFTAQVTDGIGVTATQPLSMTVNPPLTITTFLLRTTEVRVLYLQALGASGGTAPYTWSIIGGSLPAGLSFDTSGVITGTPTAAGTSSFTAQVTDSVGATVTKLLSIKVNTALTVTNLLLPAGEVGVLYSQALGASGGTTPYTWLITGGSLPAGLSLGASGVITGKLTTVGIFSFIAQVTDSVGATVTQLLSITVNPPPTITTFSLPAGKLGVLYSQILGASGGTTPYTWLITGGSLPAGLSLDTSGVITGTPTAAGTSSFTAQVTDSVGATVTQPLSVTVNPALPSSGGGVAG